MTHVDWTALLSCGGIPEPPGYRETLEAIQAERALEGPGTLPRGKGRGKSRKGKKGALQGRVEGNQQ
jgi:hypothetical protein